MSGVGMRCRWSNDGVGMTCACHPYSMHTEWGWHAHGVGMICTWSRDEVCLEEESDTPGIGELCAERVDLCVE